MIVPPKTRELAQHLLAYEATADEASGPTEAATVRVYEKLRQHFCTLAGVAAFLSLASCALVQAKSEAPDLAAVEVAADGSLKGLGEIEPQPDGEHPPASDRGMILIARLLWLLQIFLGEALTLSFIRNIWPDKAFEVRNWENKKA